MTNDITVVHVTHETVGKVGGIGAVLDGFFTSPAYLEAVDRNILVGPLFTTEGSVLDRLGPGGEVLYSSIDGYINPGYVAAFHRIENTYNAGIVYGRRTFTDPRTGVTSSPEVLLIDVRHMERGILNEFKGRLFEEFGIQSHLYENLWEFEQYIRLAPVALEALKALGAAKESSVIISHEFMGMPTVLAAIMDPTCDFRTVFHAHEVATMRRIVEEYTGHDTMYYNVIRRARDEGLHVNEVFGDQGGYFKHCLVEAAKYCDHIFAVGDFVVDEMCFMGPEFAGLDIDIIYNGVPAYAIATAEKLHSKAKLQQYCENLLGYRPDYVFTHVTRLVRSKGLWRDLRVLGTLEKEFESQGKTGVFYVLSTEVAQRRSADIFDMERRYGWPVSHREGWPDMSGGETEFYTAVQAFNARSRNIKIVFINQFGFSRAHCGSRMPEDVEFMDIRKGTDVEFGQSIYEPFGISHFEPLTFGGICVISSVSGCGGFLRDVLEREDVQEQMAQVHGGEVRNVIVADYT
ncbi:MAG TPA: hypothetical protein ENN81_10865, partial [Phycisphaerales bacterium]|nr:hypothetical protein [Phycisphaerales bacterium]